MDIQMNNLLQKNLSPTYSARTTSLNDTLNNDGLTELRSHICHLEELNGRLKYMMAEIRFLVTDAL